MTSCLTRIHSERIIHRDIKPSNLLVEQGIATPVASSCHLSGSESLILGDFGLARDNTVDASLMTIAGGTGGYAAPEQMDALGRPDERTDIFAATAVLYEAVAGVRPMLGARQIALPPEFHDELTSTAMHRGLADDPGARPASIAEWSTMFHHALGGPPSQTAVASTAAGAEPHEQAPVPRSRRTVLVGSLAAIAVLAVVILAAVLLTRSDPAITIDGPEEVRAGTTAEFTARHDTATRFRWLLPDGSNREGSAIDVDAVIPGSVELSVEALDDAGRVLARLESSFTVTEAPDGPRIVGPDRVAVGEEVRYVVDGSSDPVEWFAPSRTEVSSSLIVVPRQPGSFTISAVVDEGDRRVGTTKTIEIVGG